MWGRTWECRVTKGGCRERKEDGQGKDIKDGGSEGTSGKAQEKGACNGETWRNLRGSEPLESLGAEPQSPWGRGSTAAGQAPPLPRGEAEGLEHQ